MQFLDIKPSRVMTSLDARVVRAIYNIASQFHNTVCASIFSKKGGPTRAKKVLAFIVS
jgi:hypothetical protein